MTYKFKSAHTITMFDSIETIKTNNRIQTEKNVKPAPAIECMRWAI